MGRDGDSLAKPRSEPPTAERAGPLTGLFSLILLHYRPNRRLRCWYARTARRKSIFRGNSKDHAIVAGRRLASRADRCQRRSGQQFQLANRLHSHPLAMDLRVICKLSHFCLDGGQDAGHLFRWPLEILGGENPKRDGGNGELAAPIEYLIELARSEAVNRMRIGKAVSLPIPSVAVEDEPEDLPSQSRGLKP